MVKLKVCGVTKVDNVREIERYCDYIGLIVDPILKSPRLVDVGIGRQIVKSLSTAVPVALVASTSGIDIALKLDVNIVQIHTMNNIEQLCNYAIEHGLKIAPVYISNRSVISMEECEPFLHKIAQVKAHVEYVLIDGSKELKALANGLKLEVESYRKFAELCRKLELRPGFAGGINPDNVKHLVPLDPYLIDVSSGVEIAPGVKDVDKIIKLRQALTKT